MKPTYESINAICPIHKGSDRDRPKLIGTGTLLDFGKARFLVTAAHVLDENTEHEETLYISGGAGLVVLTGQSFSVRVPALGTREDDRLDFAVVNLGDSLADEVAKARYFLPFSLIDSDDRLTPQSHYLFSGFPANRERMYPGQKKLASKRYGYTGKSVSPQRMDELGVNPNTHIVVEFDRMETLDENNESAPFPTPQGMSGGAVWRGEGDHNLWLTETPVRLVGIGIEAPETEKVMIAVKIHVVLAAISKAYLSISEFVPLRQGFTASVNIHD